MEEELLRVRKLESLGMLAGGIAHDFNNVLTIVQVNIEQAKMRFAPGAPVREILEETASACESAVVLSSQLQTFAGGGAPIRRPVSAAKLILDAVHFARAGAALSIGVEHIADDLWSVDVDAGQIGQVVPQYSPQREAGDAGMWTVIEVRAENVVLGGGKASGSGAPR